MPHSIASIREKSQTVQGNSVPYAYPDPCRKKEIMRSLKRYVTRQVYRTLTAASRT